MASRGKRSETGKHTVRWRDLRAGEDGKRAQHRQTCPDAATAAQLQRQIDAAHALGREYVPAVDVASTVDAIADAYLDDCERLLAPATIRTRRVALDLFVRWLRSKHPRGKLHLDLLSGDNIASFHGWLLKDRFFRSGKGGPPPPGPDDETGIAPLSAKHYCQMVMGAWRWAYETERFGAEVPRPRKVRMPFARSELRQVAPTWAQMDAAIAAAEESQAGWYRKLFILLRFTGLRRGQALGLTWSDVDLEAGLLTIRGELGKSRAERAGRVEPMSPHLVAELSTWGRREGWLIETIGATRFPRLDSLQAIWARVEGVPDEVKRQPLHSFRKGFVSGLAQLGVPEVTIKALVGHDLGVTSGVYLSEAVRMEGMRAAVALIPPLGERRQGVLDFDAARRGRG